MRTLTYLEPRSNLIPLMGKQFKHSSIFELAVWWYHRGTGFEWCVGLCVMIILPWSSMSGFWMLWFALGLIHSHSAVGCLYGILNAQEPRPQIKQQHRCFGGGTLMRILQHCHHSRCRSLRRSTSKQASVIDLQVAYWPETFANAHACVPLYTIFP